MSSFRTKLTRLGAPMPRRRPGRGGVHDARPAARSFDLAELERSIAAMQGSIPCDRARLPPTEPAAALQLERYDNDAGSCWRRARRCGPHERCGAVSLSTAVEADPVLLSLLALTPALAHCRLTGALYLDTETTGLGSGTGNLAFLVGMCRFEAESECFVLEQHMLIDPDDEPAMLHAVCERIEAADCVVSFNGKAFDMPLIDGRCVMNRLPSPPRRPQLDLLHLVRRVHRHGDWRKTLVETERQVLDLRRGPDIAGVEVSERYRHYLRSGDESSLGEVLDHNAYDIMSLVGLVGLYGEPLRRLAPDELAATAMVLRRAGDLQSAAEYADEAVRRGGAALALRARAFVAKASGDRQQALLDFERLTQIVADADVRLELAKLYEHYLHAHDRALAMVVQGTGEDHERAAHRCARLQRKLGRSPGGGS